MPTGDGNAHCPAVITFRAQAGGGRACVMTLRDGPLVCCLPPYVGGENVDGGFFEEGELWRGVPAFLQVRPVAYNHNRLPAGLRFS